MIWYLIKAFFVKTLILHLSDLSDWTIKIVLFHLVLHYEQVWSLIALGHGWYQRKGFCVCIKAWILLAPPQLLPFSSSFVHLSPSVTLLFLSSFFPPPIVHSGKKSPSKFPCDHRRTWEENRLAVVWNKSLCKSQLVHHVLLFLPSQWPIGFAPRISSMQFHTGGRGGA